MSDEEGDIFSNVNEEEEEQNIGEVCERGKKMIRQPKVPCGKTCLKSLEVKENGELKKKYMMNKFVDIDPQIFSRLFRAKKTQIEMITARGYTPGKSESFIIDPGYDSNRAYKSIIRRMNDLKNVRSIPDYLSRKYDHIDKDRSLYVYYTAPVGIKKGKSAKYTSIEEFCKFLRYIIHNVAKDIILIIEKRLSPNATKCFIDFMINRSDVFIQVFFWDELIVNPTKHYMVPKHEILSNDEKMELTSNNNKYSGIDKFPIILDSDPIMRFLGGKLGDVIKITRFNVLASMINFYITYRVVNIKSQALIDTENSIDGVDVVPSNIKINKYQNDISLKEYEQQEQFEKMNSSSKKEQKVKKNRFDKGQSEYTQL